MNNETPTQKHDSVRESVLSKIEEGHITPTGRTFFLARNALFWSLWLFTVIIGAIAVAITIFTELNVGWEFYEMTHDNALTFFVASLPIVWLLLITLMVLFGIYNLRHTKTGYRYSLTTIVLAGLVGSLVGGLVLQKLGVDEYLDTAAYGLVPMHVPAQNLKERFWNQPVRGLHTGYVESVDLDANMLEMKLPDGITQLFELSVLPQGLKEFLVPGNRIRIMATTSPESDILVACHIMPWEGAMMRSFSELGERKKHLIESIEMRIEGTLGSEHEEIGEGVAIDPCLPLLIERVGQPMRARFAPVP